MNEFMQGVLVAACWFAICFGLVVVNYLKRMTEALERLAASDAEPE